MYARSTVSMLIAAAAIGCAGEPAELLDAVAADAAHSIVELENKAG